MQAVSYYKSQQVFASDLGEDIKGGDELVCDNQAGFVFKQRNYFSQHWSDVMRYMEFRTI